jgi:Tol biopolymer transport system component
MRRLLIGVLVLVVTGCQATRKQEPPVAVPTGVGPTGVPTQGPSTSSFPTDPGAATKLIAFGRADGHGGLTLQIVGSDGLGLREVAPGDLEVPRWSPDGQWIAVASVHPGGDRIVPAVIRPDGTGFREVAPDATLNMGAAAWTPTGDRIACESWDPTDASRDGIWVMRVSDGSGLRRIATRGIPGSFSADGSRLVYTVDKENGSQQLALVNVDGTGERVLDTPDLGAYPGFMPDGRTIYVAMQGKMGLFDLDGKLLRQISAPGGSIGEARITPDGTRFVFIYWPDGGDSTIASMTIDGTDLRIVAPAFGDEQDSPDWQP